MKKEIYCFFLNIFFILGIKLQAAPIPVIAVPIPVNIEKTPVIPREVIVAKVLPAVTAPM